MKRGKGQLENYLKTSRLFRLLYWQNDKKQKFSAVKVFVEDVLYFMDNSSVQDFTEAG